MKILVAGGAGYIGSLLVPSLISRGHEVDVIDLLWFGNTLPQNISVIQKDLLTCTEKDLSGYDQIIFLAGLSNDHMADYDLRRNFIYNAALPPILAHRAKNAGVRRFIYASSCTVYGNTNEQEFSELDTTAPIHPYGTAKLQGEVGVQSLASKEFSVISLRQGSTSGMSPRMRFDLFINAMFANATAKQKIVVRNALLWRPFLDITDAVQAYLRALEADQSTSGVFNIATAHYTVLEAAQLVASFFQKRNLSVSLDIENIDDSRTYKLDIRKAKKVLGVSPTGSIERVLHELAAHYCSYNDLFQDRNWNINMYRRLSTDGNLGCDI